MLKVSSLSLTLFILQDIFLICSSIYTNCTLLLYLKILKLSLTKALAILLCFGIALAVLNSLFTQL